MKLEKVELAAILSAPVKIYFNLFCLNSFSWQWLGNCLSLYETVHMCTSLCLFHCCWKNTRIPYVSLQADPVGKKLWTKINSLHFSLLKKFSLHINLSICMLYLFYLKSWLKCVIVVLLVCKNSHHLGVLITKCLFLISCHKLLLCIEILWQIKSIPIALQSGSWVKLITFSAVPILI